MERVRGPVSSRYERALYELPSLSEVRKRFENCYSISRGERIDLTATDYAGCAYVLECKETSARRAEQISLIRHKKKTVPWWVAPANSAEKRLYVGRTKDLPGRVWQHIQGSQQRGAHFTETFPPIRISRAFLYQDYSMREELEAKVTQSIDKANPEAFVYSDRYDTLRGFKHYGEDT